MQTSFRILVTGSPTTSQAHLSAIRFIRAAVNSGHKVESAFFYQEAVHVANQFIVKPTDEAQLAEDWKSLSQEYGFELQVCVAAGNRRGVINEEEAKLNQLTASTIDAEFKVLGLGQLAASLSIATTKLIHFK